VHREGGGPVGWATHLLEFKDFEADVSPAHPGLTPSATFLCRAEAFDDAGGFPDMWPGEDWVFCARLRKQQCRIDRDCAAITYHAPPRSLRRFVSHQRRLGMTSAQARAQTGLPGAWFVRHPTAVPALFFGRLARGFAWILRYRPLEAWLCLLCLPLYVAGLVSWTAGFAVASFRLRRDAAECGMGK
jgi:cellulose synthase/poly-beta-1,6-N-acetylglucosamine synthase-like glycosyltransferase